MPHRDGRTGPRWRPLALMAVTAVVAYLPVLGSLLALCRTDKYYGYLGLVLPTFALLLWVSRDRRSAIAGHGHIVGVPVVLFALTLLVLGRSVASLQLQSLSLVIAVAGIAVCLRGIEWARAAAYPLAFLLFLVPVPRGVFEAVTLDVQRLLTRHAGMLLESTGIPVRMEEIAIHLPTVTLQIVEGCNGLRFLMGLVVVVAGAAGILVPSIAARALLITLAVPAALAANVIRITALGLAAYWVGPDAAEGWSHEIIGKAAWGTSTVTLIMFAWLLGRRPAGAALDQARALVGVTGARAPAPAPSPGGRGYGRARMDPSTRSQ